MRHKLLSIRYRSEHMRARDPSSLHGPSLGLPLLADEELESILVEESFRGVRIGVGP